MQIAQHDCDHISFRDRSVRIIFKRDRRRGDDDFLSRPHFLKRGPGSPLHVRLLDDKKTARIETLFFQQPFRKQYILSGVRRFFLDENFASRNPGPNGDLSEFLSLCLCPLPGQATALSGKENQRGQSPQEQLGAILSDARVVAAEDQDAVRRLERLVQLHVVPDTLREGVDAFRIHGCAARRRLSSCTISAAPESRRREKTRASVADYLSSSGVASDSESWLRLA